MRLENVVLKCPNCGNKVPILTNNSFKETTYSTDTGDISVIYTDCQVCGEKTLKQIDTEVSASIAHKVVKLKLLGKQKKLSDKQKKRLLKLNRQLDDIRKDLNKTFWDEVYQSLNS